MVWDSFKVGPRACTTNKQRSRNTERRQQGEKRKRQIRTQFRTPLTRGGAPSPGTVSHQGDWLSVTGPEQLSDQFNYCTTGQWSAQVDLFSLDNPPLHTFFSIAALFSPLYPRVTSTTWIVFVFPDMDIHDSLSDLATSSLHILLHHTKSSLLQARSIPHCPRENY